MPIPKAASIVTFGIAFLALPAFQAAALYMPDMNRPNYEVPEILDLPDKVAIEMKFRPLDIQTEGEVYPVIAPGFRDLPPLESKPADEPPDAFTKGLNLESAKALYWKISLLGGSRWIALEYDENRPVALYVDLDSDGELDDNERIAPTDTTAHFVIPAFRRLREGYRDDQDIKIFLDATSAGSVETPPILFCYSMDFRQRWPRMELKNPLADGIPDDPFLRHAGVRKRNAQCLKIRVMGRPEWVAVTHRNGLAESLFFDLNGNGSFEDRERVEPKYYESRFVLPTFMARTAGGGQEPCRISLYAEGRKAPALCSGAVWEGPIQLGRKTYRLILFDTNMNGVFSDFEEDRYTFFSETGAIRILDEVIGFGSSQSVPTHTQRRLFQIEGVNIFEMQPLEISKSDPSAGSLLLTRDTSAYGWLNVLLKDQQAFIKSGGLTIRKSERDDIRFAINPASTVPARTPAWTYNIENAQFNYRAETADTWSTDCHGGEFEVDSDNTRSLKLGDLSLHVRSKNFKPDVETPEFQIGTELELTREVTGTLGEVYTRFRNESTKKWIASKIRILDSNGTEIASGSLDYG